MNSTWITKMDKKRQCREAFEKGWIPLNSNAFHASTTPQPASKMTYLRVLVLEGLELEFHLDH